MKKFISLLLCTTLLISLFCINVNAAEAEELTIPRVYVTTDDGNGNTIEKADGYVGANIKIEDVDGSVLRFAATAPRSPKRSRSPLSSQRRRTCSAWARARSGRCSRTALTRR